MEWVFCNAVYGHGGVPWYAAFGDDMVEVSMTECPRRERLEGFPCRIRCLLPGCAGPDGVAAGFAASVVFISSWN